MPFEPRSADWLEEIHELNRLFLTYVRALADAGRPPLGLPRPVARWLVSAPAPALERVAQLPTAVFRLRLACGVRAHGVSAPQSRLGRMQVSLALTILASAWHMARSRPFEARMFLHLSAGELERLRVTALGELPSLADDPGVLSCAYTETALTWSALAREERRDSSRMLILIALQPNLGTLGGSPGPTPQAGLRSLA